jgi:hypothetical protein
MTGLHGDILYVVWGFMDLVDLNELGNQISCPSGVEVKREMLLLKLILI